MSVTGADRRSPPGPAAPSRNGKRHRYPLLLARDSVLVGRGFNRQRRDGAKTVGQAPARLAGYLRRDRVRPRSPLCMAQRSRTRTPCHGGNLRGRSSMYRRSLPSRPRVERCVRARECVPRPKRGIMRRMKAEEANRFYEEDEDPSEVFALFDAAEKGRTSPPTAGSERDSADWTRRIRHGMARILRRAANVIEPSHIRA